MTDMMWEDEPLEKLTNNGELVAFKHTGFWKPMDALRDKLELEEMWKQNKAAWRKWG
jgi:glucose-1-phosphate cytidylyltransferase